jgi:hypothetical protein
MRKLFLVLLVGMISSTLFGQSNFYPIGAKWVYRVNELCSSPQIQGYDTIISQKDTLINGYNLRKLTYINSSLDANMKNLFFLITTSGVFRYDKDSLRLHFPLNINKGDSTIVNIFTPSAVYKYENQTLVCDSITSLIVNDMEIKTYCTSVRLKSKSSSKITLQYHYNNVCGLSNFSSSEAIVFHSPNYNWIVACSESRVDLLNFKYDKLQFNVV